MKYLLFSISCTIIFSLISCNQESKTLQKPNILWIVADDLGTDLGCYGDSLVKTPNLDNLASQSILYTNCHTSAAVCSPSRSGMITGMYPVSINSHQHRTHPDAMKSLPEGVKVITEYFEQAGYFTFNANVNDTSKAGKTDYNFHVDYEIYDGTDWTQRAEGQPFFGQIQIFFPHRPFKHDKEHPVDQSKVKLPHYFADHKTLRQDWAFYLESIQFVDKKVGQVLERLERDGLLDNTIIFFVGDQGSPMMRHKQFLYDGGTNTPLIVRFPNKQRAGELSDELVSNIDLSAASLSLAGIEIPEYMQGQNFLGEHTPRTELFTMRDRRDETVDRIRALRTKDYKFIKNFYPDRPYTQYNSYKRNLYPALPVMFMLKEQGKLTPEQLTFLEDTRPELELYDLKNDPFELHNLADDPDYAEIKSELSQKLNAWIDKSDLGTYPEDATQLEEWANQSAKTDSIRKMSKGLAIDVTNADYAAWWDKYFESILAGEPLKGIRNY